MDQKADAIVNAANHTLFRSGEYAVAREVATGLYPVREGPEGLVVMA